MAVKVLRYASFTHLLDVLDRSRCVSKPLGTQAKENTEKRRKYISKFIVGFEMRMHLQHRIKNSRNLRSLCVCVYHRIYL